MSLYPKFITAKEAAALIPDGASIMMGGFMGCGAALQVINELSKLPTKDLHLIINDSARLNGPDGEDYYAWAKLIHTGQAKSYLGSHLGTNPEAQKKQSEGTLQVDLVPQGSFVEMIRAGGYGLGAVVTPTGIDTMVEQSPYCLGRQTIEGKDYLLMKPVTADWCLIKGYKVDKAGNVWYKGTTRNFSPLMATAAKKVIVEAENLVDVGEIPPEDIMTPGIIVDYIVEVQK